MHLLSRDALKEAGRNHADLEKPLDVWYRVAKKAEWKSLADVRRTYPHADAVGKYTVFNIKGNDYYLIVEINYRTGRIFIRHVLTHQEYDRGKWKPRRRAA
ncbi:MAG: type II toxin-antitoxin system HigB family toxin [Acidobacteria bacterium]|nr:MAG: type II toxin-antitoxin system HigB family toxin [Acidobacteriota bacterium]